MNRETPFTLRVEQYLREIDDFASIPMIAAKLQLTRNQVSASLHNLRRACVVDVIIAPDGTGWWFTCPPEQDTRVVHQKSIKQGITRRRTHRKEKKL